MRVREECYECLRHLIHQACTLATEDEELRSRAEMEGLKILDEMFPSSPAPPAISSLFHRAIKRITGNPDPYRFVKDQEIKTAREVFSRIKTSYEGGLRPLLQLSVIGNAFDFFKPQDDILKDILAKPHFVIDDSDRLEEDIKHHIKKVIFLADNAGEAFFDMPLIEWMRSYVDLTYVVKGGAVQNDMTLEDLRRAGVLEKMGKLTTTGSDHVGVDLNSISEEFRKMLQASDLIFAKGMGNYETLTEVDGLRAFYLLKAKCKPVAEDLRVPLDSYVALYRG